MTTWKNIAPVIALSLSTALAGTGCLAQTDRDEASEITAAQDDAADTTATAAADAEQGEEIGATHDPLIAGFPFPIAHLGCLFHPRGFGGPFFGCGGVTLALGWPFFCPRCI